MACEHGCKLDTGKERWDRLPWAEVRDVVRVLNFGIEKYAVDNWQLVPQARDRYFAAAIRHMVAWQQGERTDGESGLPHMAHAACCLLFLAWFDRNGTVDDRKNPNT